MKEFYIPVHFFERDPEDDDLVLFVTQDEIEDTKFNKRLRSIAGQYTAQEEIYDSEEDMVDAIFNTLAKELGGVWSYCKTLDQLVIGDSEQYSSLRDIKQVTATELAEMLIKLTPGENLYFYEKYDEQTGDTEGLYGATMINSFDSYAIFMNCSSGGIPFIFDVSSYDSDLNELSEAIREYFTFMEDKPSCVYVEQDS